ncbi:MAG: hypothetical protein H6732_17280 [Alphaproteobacteria bacterium]|nr:hypothetical protein [Alphaproteobacteria bacterium]
MTSVLVLVVLVGCGSGADTEPAPAPDATPEASAVVGSAPAPGRVRIRPASDRRACWFAFADQLAAGNEGGWFMPGDACPAHGSACRGVACDAPVNSTWELEPAEGGAWVIRPTADPAACVADRGAEEPFRQASVGPCDAEPFRWVIEPAEGDTVLLRPADTPQECLLEFNYQGPGTGFPGLSFPPLIDEPCPPDGRHGAFLVTRAWVLERVDAP